MREMKDSGIEWIGEIPKDWKVEKTKYHFASHKQIVGSNVDCYERLALTMKGVVKRSKEDDVGLQPEKFETYQVLKENELVFKLIDLQNVSTSRVGLSPYIGIVSPAYIIISDKGEVSPEYAENWFLSLWQREVFNHIGDDGVRSSLNQGDLLNIPIAFPSYSEQQAIANYLDRKCAEIDTLTSDIETQIETLEQYKRSVITEAVTKGLNPDAEMKDSGVEWIGETPKIWNISRLKYVCSMQSGDNLTAQVIQEEGNYKVYGGNGVRGYYYKFNTTGENILIGRQGALAGNVHYTNEKIWATDHAVVTKAYPNILTKFLLYVLGAMNLNQYAVDTAAQPGLAVNKIINLAIPFPAFETQQVIVSFLDKKCNDIEDIITVRQTQLNAIEEYKKSLIFEYVTGKKEVP